MCSCRAYLQNNFLKMRPFRLVSIVVSLVLVSFLPVMPAGERQAPASAQAAAIAPSVQSHKEIRALMEQLPVKAALANLEAQHETMIRDLEAITETPAPPFKEQARAKLLLQLFRSAGLKNAYID